MGMIFVGNGFATLLLLRQYYSSAKKLEEKPTGDVFLEGGVATCHLEAWTTFDTLPLERTQRGSPKMLTS